MKCPEVSPLVPRFFDGELEGRQMRVVALHVTRCADCEQELRQLEAVQSLLGAQVAEQVDAIDMSRIWAGVAKRIETPVPSWRERLAAWRESFALPDFSAAWPALAGAVAVMALALGVWVYMGPGSSGPIPTGTVANGQPDPSSVQSVALMGDEDKVNSAMFDSIVGSVRELTVDPENGTAVVWVSDTGDVR